MNPFSDLEVSELSDVSVTPSQGSSPVEASLHGSCFIPSTSSHSSSPNDLLQSHNASNSDSPTSLSNYNSTFSNDYVDPLNNSEEVDSLSDDGDADSLNDEDVDSLNDDKVYSTPTELPFFENLPELSTPLYLDIWIVKFLSMVRYAALCSSVWLTNYLMLPLVNC